jgi:hypothetical protein
MLQKYHENFGKRVSAFRVRIRIQDRVLMSRRRQRGSRLTRQLSSGIEQSKKLTFSPLNCHIRHIVNEPEGNSFLAGKAEL